MLFAILGRFLKVRMRDPELDLTEQMIRFPPSVLDDLFFIEFGAPDSEEALKADSRCYLPLEYPILPDSYGNNLVWDNHMEHEEGARRWRTSRLAEKGFPEYDEVLEIYQYITKEQHFEPSDAPSSEYEEESNAHSMVNFPLKVLDSPNLFRRSLDKMSAVEERDRLCAELAHLANKVIIADARTRLR